MPRDGNETNDLAPEGEPNSSSHADQTRAHRPMWQRLLASVTWPNWHPGATPDPATGPRRDRDYEIDLKMLGLAVGLEVAVASVQWYGGLLMAESYGRGRPIEQQMMMLAPSLYFFAELTRVPLALAFRMHKSRILRATLLIFGLLSATITVKSVSQIGELMYRPRIYEVRSASIAVAKSEADMRALEEQTAASNGALVAARSQLAAAQASLDETGARLAQLPPPSCSPVLWYDREGRERRDRRCTSDPRTLTLTEALKAAKDIHTSATEKVRVATSTWSNLVDRAPDMKAAYADAEAKQARAIMESQVHSFTGMMFGKSAAEVSEREIYLFLLVFIFVPAVVISLVGFVLTCAAVRRLPATHISIDRKTTEELRRAFGP